MENAQAALIAAAITDTTGDAGNVAYLASEYLAWLAAQDKAGPGKGAKKPDYVTLCGDVSKGGRTCTNLPHPETGLHYSDEDGVYWGEAGPVVIEKADPVHIPKPQERHFLPAPSAKHATCGAENRAVRVTTFVRDVTCPACKEELGL